MYLMLDFETLGTAADTIVVSLGAVAFNKERIVLEKLYIFEITEQIKGGRTFSEGTLQWWMQPSRAEARKVFYAPEVPHMKMSDFFPDFESFIDEALFEVHESRDSLRPIGNGANFDVSLIENIFRTLHPKGETAIPWKFWNVWCFRTLNHVFNLYKLVARPHGTYHNALDDARYQAHCFMAMLNNKRAPKDADAK